MKKILFLFFLLLMHCGPIEGEFAWARSDDRDIEEPEKSLLEVEEYRLGRDRVFFYSHETISWIYEINSGSFERDGFLAALYENNNTPQPVEVALRQVPVESADGRNYIRQSYDPLPAGKYLLRLAHNSEMIDQVEFRVFPSPGNTSEDMEDSVPDDLIVRYSGIK